MALLVLALALGTTLALLSPGLIAGPSMDAAVFTLVAERMIDGQMLYLDLWDHKPPGIYLLNAAAQLVLPWLDPWHASWILTVFSSTATGLLVWLLLRGLGNRWLAVVGAILSVAGAAQFVVSLGAGLSEQAATLPALAALVLAQRFGLVRWAVAGVLFAAAVLISPHLLAVGVALLVMALLRTAVTGRLLAALLFGGALAVAAVLAWLWGSGALLAAIDQVVTYNAAYRSANAAGTESTSARVLSLAVLSSLFLLAPALPGVAALRRADRHRRSIGLPALGWLLAGVALIALTGRVYGHYLAPLAVPLATLAVLGGEDVLRRLHRTGLILGAAGVMIAAVGLSIAVVAWYLPQEAGSTAALSRRAEALAEVVQRRTDPDEPIFIWGNAPAAYLAAERDPAGRYLYLFPLTTPGYSSPAQIQSLVDEWAADPPAVIVDAGSAAPGEPGWAPLLIDRPVLDVDPRRLDLLDPLRDFVAANYEQVADVDGWPVYAPRDGS